MSYTNPLTACQGTLEVKQGESFQEIEHVVRIDIERTDTGDSMVTSSTGGKMAAMPGCPDVTINAEWLALKDDTDEVTKADRRHRGERVSPEQAP